MCVNVLISVKKILKFQILLEAFFRFSSTLILILPVI